MVLLFLKMNVRPEKRKELLQTLEAIMERVRKETGCVKANLYQDMENDRGFMLIEEWRNQQDLENHIRSDSFSVLQGANGLLEREPEIIASEAFQSSLLNK
ncbi:MAG: putative quinol monooxygenase [Desulfobacterales bacterium]